MEWTRWDVDCDVPPLLKLAISAPPEKFEAVAAMLDPEAATGEGNDNDSVAGKTAAFSVKEIIANYLQVKNALVKDNAKDAATAATTIVVILDKINKASLPANQLKIYNELQDDIKENAEHIGANADKIEHQREHFEMVIAASKKAG